MLAHEHLIQEIHSHAFPLGGRPGEYAPLLDRIDDARFVLIGEATHGTDEFYRIRAQLTKKLIQYYGFSAVAIEGDWPDTYRANRYVHGDASIGNANEALSGFQRFPEWMWRNEPVAEFLDWLREYNSKKATIQEKAGFYGLDLYGLHFAIAEVIRYLERIDPEGAEQARQHYSCFDHYSSSDAQEYGYAATFGLAPNCEHEVIAQLLVLQQRRLNYLQHNGMDAKEEFFCAEQNARLVKNAESYYRSMFQSRISSWNLRDQHMMEVVQALDAHVTTKQQKPAKIVVWAHNSHIGDARATELSAKGESNLGQFMRETYGRDAFLIGFSTYSGTVTAASEWGGHPSEKRVREALNESYEALFHETGLANFLLLLRDNEALAKHLDLSRLQRAIGVLYLPKTERLSHYFYAKLPEQFDALIHLDTTHALEPLENSTLWHQRSLRNLAG